MLKLAGAASLTAIASAVSLDGTNAAARKRGRGVACSKNADCLSGVRDPKDRTGHRTCGCAAGWTRCGNGCVDLENDPNHCGACSQTCRAVEGQSAICSGGTCLCADCGGSACPPGYCGLDGCLCTYLTQNRLLCAGVVFLVSDGPVCSVDGDCPGRAFRQAFRRSPWRVYQMERARVIFACGAPLTPSSRPDRSACAFSPAM